MRLAGKASMDLILHIGTEKTGTTSIQQYLLKNTDALRGEKILLPLSIMHGKSGNHRRLVSFAANEDAEDDFYRMTGLVCLEERQRQVAIWKKSFDQELIESHDCHTAIISSEHIHSRLRHFTELNKFRDYIQSRFQKIEIVVYLRDPLETVLSSISTSVKSGSSRSNIPLPTNPRWNFLVHHKNTLRTWRSLFPQSTITPRIFSQQHLQHGDILADFSMVCNLDITKLVRVNLQNQSLNWLGTELLAKLNSVLPAHMPEGGLNPVRSEMLSLFSEAFQRPPMMTPSSEVIERYHEAFLESNEWVRLNYFPHLSELFPRKFLSTSDFKGWQDKDLAEVSYLIEKILQRKFSS